MNAREKGFLLLCSTLGNPDRKVLSTAQLRTLAIRMASMAPPAEERELSLQDLRNLGYHAEAAEQILQLLSDEALLQRYLARGKQMGCVPLTRVTPEYPADLRRHLGFDSPGVLWARGDLSLLSRKKIALVGSRDIRDANAEFAARVGCEAALQGYVLVSGNARGADRIAQTACMNAGGQFISVVSDELQKQELLPGVLYLSETGFDCPFTSNRALSRNRVIHALGEKTLVAQCTPGKGGTWSGTVRNLRDGYSSVFCFSDGSEGAAQLAQLGAELIDLEELVNLSILPELPVNLFGKT